MSEFDELVARPGVLMAGRFGPDGRVAEHKTTGLYIAIVFFMHGAGIRFWNYALYCGAIAAGVLLLVDLPRQSNYGAEGYRVLWTLCGVGIAALVMLLAGLLAKRAAKAPPGPPADVPAQRSTPAEQDLASRSGHAAEPGAGQAG